MMSYSQEQNYQLIYQQYIQNLRYLLKKADSAALKNNSNTANSKTANSKTADKKTDRKTGRKADRKKISLTEIKIHNNRIY